MGVRRLLQLFFRDDVPSLSNVLLLLLIVLSLHPSLHLKLPYLQLQRFMSEPCQFLSWQYWQPQSSTGASFYLLLNE